MNKFIEDNETIEAFREQLKLHDWFYCMSADSDVRCVGRAYREGLTELANRKGGEHKELLSACLAWERDAIMGKDVPSSPPVGA